MTIEEKQFIVSCLASDKRVSTELFVKLTNELLEQRTCKNCKYHSEIGKSYKRCLILNISTSKHFGCNEFERIEND